MDKIPPDILVRRVEESRKAVLSLEILGLNDSDPRTENCGQRGEAKTMFSKHAIRFERKQCFQNMLYDLGMAACWWRSAKLLFQCDVRASV